MTFIHVAIGIAVVATSLATLAAALLGKDELFDNVAATTAGLLIIQTVVGFFLFTSQTNEGFNAFLHILPPVVSLAALLGARAAQGDRRKLLMSVAAFLVLIAGISSYLTGFAAKK